MTNTTPREMPDAVNPCVRFDEGEVALAKRRRAFPPCTSSVLRGNGIGVKTVLLLVSVLAAWTLLAALTVLSEKSYFIDTRCPIVAMSVAGELDTYPGGMFIIVR